MADQMEVVGHSDPIYADEEDNYEDDNRKSEDQEMDSNEMNDEQHQHPYAIDDGGDDDDDDDDDMEEKQLIQSIKEAHDRISLNPFDYDGHLALIDLYSKSGDLDELRAARQHMSEHFPLSPNLWLSWIQDEKGNDDLVHQLFERAIQDYVSIDVWLEYAVHALGWLSKDNGQVDRVESIRQVFERAITAVGAHPSKGHLVWNLYRTLEMELYALVEDKPTLVQQIYSLFKRQLCTTLLTSEQTFKEFELWIQKVQDMHADLNLDVESVRAAHNKVLIELPKLQELEDQLQDESIESFNNYIHYERSKNRPARVIIAYERALIPHCLNAELWLDYVRYLDKQFNTEQIILPVYQRAVRNCPWSSPLWIRYFRSLERFGKPSNDIQSVFEKALSAGFQTGNEYKEVWLAYLEHRRRQTDFENEQQVDRLRTCFIKADQHLSSIDNSDIGCEVLIFQSKVEAKMTRQLDKFREIWEDILSERRDLSSQAQYWIEYATLEKMYGEEDKYRKILLKAMQMVQDWPETIGQLLVKFDREEGKSLDQLLESIDKQEKMLKHITERRAAIARKEADKHGPKKEIQPKRRAETHQVAPVKKQKIVQQVTEKDSDGFTIPFAPTSSSSSSSSFSSSSTTFTTTESVNGSHMKSNANFLKPSDDDETKQFNTVFVSNIDFSLPTETLREALSKFGTIVDLRRPLNAKGLNRGYCYVEYASIQDACRALKNDRFEINGRPTYISKMKDKGQKNEFKYRTEMERNKLYVCSLSPEVTQQDLEQLFAQHGRVKEVRLVTYRNGHSKGIAYVDFVDERDAQAALVLNDFELKGKNIRVAISDPKSATSTSNKKKLETLGEAQSVARPSLEHGRQRISGLFKPRQLMRPS